MLAIEQLIDKYVFLNKLTVCGCEFYPVKHVDIKRSMFYLVDGLLFIGVGHYNDINDNVSNKLGIVCRSRGGGIYRGE